MNPGLAERDERVIWHPYTPQKYAPAPIPIVKGDGVYIIDSNGNKYIDTISSWWVTLHGHAHPYIAKRIYEQALQLEQVIFAGFTHEPAIQLAEKLLNFLQGSYLKIFYSDNGSTSVEVALKMAIQYWWNLKLKDRNRIIALSNSYHGDTFGAMSVSERGVFTLAFHDRLFEVDFINLSSPDFEKQLNSVAWEQAACFIYEPLVQGAGGMIMYPPAALEESLKHCRKHEVITIADEVMTGFGRTGKSFASHYLKHQPDIVCLSKGLTGGTLPLGVTACTEKIHKAYVQDDAMRTFFHGHSFTANPLACTAALASLELLDNPECAAAISRIGSQHSSFIESLQSQPYAAFINNARSLGTIAAFEWNRKESEYLNSVSKTIAAAALQKNVFVRPLGNTVYLMPPYCISEDELERVYEVLREVLSTL